MLLLKISVLIWVDILWISSKMRKIHWLFRMSHLLIQQKPRLSSELVIKLIYKPLRKSKYQTHYFNRINEIKMDYLEYKLTRYWMFQPQHSKKITLFLEVVYFMVITNKSKHISTIALLLITMPILEVYFTLDIKARFNSIHVYLGITSLLLEEWEFSKMMLNLSSKTQ